MADEVRVTGLPDAGSKEAVALSLFRNLRNAAASKQEQLALFAECLKVVQGYQPSEAATFAQS